jgi:PEP-CTERM motif
MKPSLMAALGVFGVLFAAASVRADMANYESTVAGQSPSYLFNFDNSLASDIGSPSGTFTGSGTTGFANDYSGNANDSLSVASGASGYSLSTPNIISGSGSTVSSGSFSFLFNLSTVGGTAYFFSDSDNTSGTAGSSGAAASALALDFSSGTFQFKVGNHSFSSATYLPAPTASTWYYFGATWNFDGTPADDTVSWWIGPAGGTLVAGDNALVPYSSWTATTTVGDGGALIVGNRRALNSSPGGSFDELATWNSILTGSQFQAQFDALTTAVPEPSTIALIGAGTLMLLGLRRRMA